MKIAFVGQKGIPMKFGGVEKHVERLAVGLSEKGHKVFVYTRPWYSNPAVKSYKGVKLVSIRSWKTKNLDAITHTFFATLDVLKKNYDIVHYHGVGPALLAWIPKYFKKNTKVIITFHCVDRFHQKWGWFARFMLRLGEWMAIHASDDTIVVSKTLQLYTSRKYKADTVYVPNGVDCHKKVGVDRIKRKYGLQKGEYFLFLSRLVKHKGAHYLIDAYKKLTTDKKLVIVGDAAFTSKYVKKWKKLAGDSKKIVFTGNVSGDSQEWYELFSNAYLFVHPSESEGLPIVVLEAMSFGLPVLVSDITENMEIVGSSHGFSFKNKDVKDLKNKLQYLLGTPELVQKVGEDARKHVEIHYSWDDITQSVLRVYQDALETSPAADPNSAKTI